MIPQNNLKTISLNPAYVFQHFTKYKRMYVIRNPKHDKSWIDWSEPLV